MLSGEVPELKLCVCQEPSSRHPAECIALHLGLSVSQKTAINLLHGVFGVNAKLCSRVGQPSYAEGQESQQL